MKEIPLTQGKVAIIDDDMYNLEAIKSFGEFAKLNSGW
jgi:hypothetical protein